ncbi:MAG: hypothetical protein KGD58_18935 [Candidatus Lokiarchaeota archaeon]|nr:hypothetical protein [Candidatus Lokiarchaeota archaeon]
MIQSSATINLDIIIESFFLICIFNVLVLSVYTFFKKIAKIRDKSNKTKEDEKEKVEMVEVKEEKQSTVEFRTIVIEQPELNNEVAKSAIEKAKKDSLLIPSKLKKQIEKIILKVLYEERAVKTLKLLSDKVLENAARQKVTVSEKVINLIINQMNKIKQIEFTQKEGWKIKI